MTPLNLPDTVSLNEVRIAKSSLSDIPVRKCYFGSIHRKHLGKALREEGYIAVYSGDNTVFIIRTKQNAVSIQQKLPDDVNLEISSDVDKFCDLPPEIARRFVFSFIETAASRQELYRGDGWQLFSLKTEFHYGHKAVEIDIHEEEDFFSVFIDPTILILIPITKLPTTALTPERPLIKLIEPHYQAKIRQWNHSIFTTRAGVFVQLESPLLERLQEEDAIIVKRTPSAQDLIRYPAFALRVIATRQEIDNLNLGIQQKKTTQPLPQFRFSETKEWVARIFPEDTLSINDRVIHVENRVSIESNAIKYQPHYTKQSHSIWYQDSKLTFDDIATKTEWSAVNGLRKFGPYDTNSQPPRAFNKMRPFLIIPDVSDLKLLCNQLLGYLEEGYKKRENAQFGDTDFQGIKQEFKLQFVFPGAQDTYFISATNAQEYAEAAENAILQWVGSEQKDINRIAIVIVPDQSGNKEDADSNNLAANDDPYLDLKKRFIEVGLPSQMIEISQLANVADSSFALGHLLWNLALDLYVKLGGKPWSLARQLNDVNCLIGLGFGRASNLIKNSIYVGIANVFDEHGQWLSFTSEDKSLTADELTSLMNREFDVVGTSSFKLQLELTRKITQDSLATYTVNQNNRLATHVVIHKNGLTYDSEALGFLQALSDYILSSGMKLADSKFALVSILKNHSIRMYGPNYPQLKAYMRYTVSRGTVRILNENTALVATTGKNRVYYPGIGTPRPLMIQRYVPSNEVFRDTGFSANQMYSIIELVEQVLALTQLHWGATRTIRLPITSEYAQRIAKFVARSQVRTDLLLKLKKLWWI